MAFRLRSARTFGNLTALRVVFPARGLVTAAPVKTMRPTAVAGLHAAGNVRHDWTREEIKSIYDSSLMDLLFYGVSV